jgi:integrative and conjugative element protein (TIGR02256 family)
VDDDVTTPKADALAARLRAIRPDVKVEIDRGNLLWAALELEDPSKGADVVIDTTGSVALAEKLEARWPLEGSSRAVYISMVVGPAAERGFAVVVPTEHTGGTADAIRRAKLEACTHARLAPYVEEFWPSRGTTRLFQPEPGCSEPTFVGSAADMAQMAGALLNRVATALSETARTASAHFLTRADICGAGPAAVSIPLPPDLIVAIPEGYRVRIARPAWKEIEATMSQSRRRRGRKVETGGLLFGERNAAARVLWVSEASGPPSDSKASATGFECGVAGVADLNKEKRHRTRGSVAHVGMWHTHPDSAPRPSDTDLAGMCQIVKAVDPPTPESLLLILGGDLLTRPEIGLSYFSRRELHG